jgi:hypothetical protein
LDGEGFDVSSPQLVDEIGCDWDWLEAFPTFASSLLRVRPNGHEGKIRVQVETINCIWQSASGSAP